MTQACDQQPLQQESIACAFGRNTIASLRNIQSASCAVACMQCSNGGFTFADIVHAQLPSVG